MADGLAACPGCGCYIDHAEWCRVAADRPAPPAPAPVTECVDCGKALALYAIAKGHVFCKACDDLIMDKGQRRPAPDAGGGAASTSIPDAITDAIAEVRATAVAHTRNVAAGEPEALFPLALADDKAMIALYDAIRDAVQGKTWRHIDA